MTLKRTVPAAVVLVAVISILGACGDDDAGGSGDADAVVGTLWGLDELSGEPVPDGVKVTLEFDGEQVAGSGGCNQYNSAASFDDGVVTIAPEIVSTRMFCEGPASDVEFAYLAVLPSATGFVVEDDTLTLTDTDGDVVLVYSATG
jgi:heat shock protein HslJ